MKLTEATKRATPALVTTVPQYFKRYGLSKYVVGNTYSQSCRFDRPHAINTWEGAPTTFTGDLVVESLNFTSIQQLKLDHVTYLGLYSKAGYQSYSGIHRIVRSCNQIWLKTATDMLGVILIPNLSDVFIVGNGTDFSYSNEQQMEIARIFTDQLRQKRQDVYKFQERLIDAGYEAIADGL